MRGISVSQTGGLLEEVEWVIIDHHELFFLLVHILFHVIIDDLKSYIPIWKLKTSTNTQKGH